MWRTVSRVALIMALLAGAPAIAGATDDTFHKGKSGGASVGSTRHRPAAASAPAANRDQGPAGQTHGPTNLMPCRTGPPYTSLPCFPTKR
jgi:hypothetical protein